MLKFFIVFYFTLSFASLSNMISDINYGQSFTVHLLFTDPVMGYYNLEVQNGSEEDQFIIKEIDSNTTAMVTVFTIKYKKNPTKPNFTGFIKKVYNFI